jgi:hypothetical protein
MVMSDKDTLKDLDRITDDSKGLQIKSPFQLLMEAMSSKIHSDEFNEIMDEYHRQYAAQNTRIIKLTNSDPDDKKGLILVDIPEDHLGFLSKVRFLKDDELP